MASAELVLISDTTNCPAIPIKIKLDPSKETLIGRDTNCDKVIPYHGISRRHFTLKTEEDKASGTSVWLITDLSSNGLEIGPQPPQRHPSSSKNKAFTDVPLMASLNKNPARIRDNDFINLVPDGKLVYQFKAGPSPSPEVIFLGEKVAGRNSPHSKDDNDDKIKRKKDQNQEESSTSLLTQQKKRIKELEAELQITKQERLLEQKEQQKKIERISEQIKQKVIGLFETELACCVCNGVFIEPTISPSCGHTFCYFCITEWLKQKPECPICRAAITTAPTRQFEVGNWINSWYDMLGEEWKKRRQEQVQERARDQAQQLEERYREQTQRQRERAAAAQAQQEREQQIMAQMERAERERERIQREIERVQRAFEQQREHERTQRERAQREQLRRERLQREWERQRERGWRY